jgi:hypothetical protein
VSNTPPQSNTSSIDAVYAQLKRHDIEEFYAGYQRWSLQQQIVALHTRLEDLRQHIAENTERMQEVHPTAIALATLARLQSNGVSDVALLDRMLEQGELWLDRTMQQLDYFEQLDDFISDDYTQWCQHALEGAYDWIDSMLVGSPSLSPPVTASEEETLIVATEELLLQKLSSDEDVDEASMLETTLKRPAISIAHPEEPVPPAEDIPVAEEAVPIVEEAVPFPAEAFPGDVTPASDLPVGEAVIQEHVEAEVVQTLEEEPPGDATPASDLPVEEAVIQEHVEAEIVQTLEEELPVERSDTAHVSPEQPAEALPIASDEQPGISVYLTQEEALFVEDTSAREEELTAIQDNTAFEEPLSVEEIATPETEPAASGVPGPASENNETGIEGSAPEDSGQQPQSRTPKRPNFIRRLFEKIWGS